MLRKVCLGLQGSLVLLLSVVVMVVVAAGQGGGNSRAPEMGPKREVPDDVLFKDQSAFCEGCYALVTEMEKLLTLWQKEKGSIEDHIDAALLTTCTTERLRAYVLSPPKMARLCSGIRAHYIDQIGLAVLKHYSKQRKPAFEELFVNICRKAIPACPRNLKPMSVTREENRKQTADEKEAKTAPPETRKRTASIKYQTQPGGDAVPVSGDTNTRIEL